MSSFLTSCQELKLHHPIFQGVVSHFVLLRVAIVMMKHHGGKGLLLGLHFYITTHDWNQDRNSNTAETQRQELMRRPEGMLLTGSLPWLTQPAFLLHAGPPTQGWSHPLCHEPTHISQ